MMTQPIRRIFSLTALALIALSMALCIAPRSVEAQAKKRVEVYTRPQSPAAADFGYKALLDYATTQKLTARDITEKLFRDYSLIQMSDVLRTRVLSTELALLNKLIKDVNLENLVGASTSAEALAATLDAKRISESQIIRELARVFDGEGVENLRDQLPYYPKEALAYWLGDVNQGAQRGYNERYLLARLKEADKVLGRPANQVRTTVRMDDLERLSEEENEDADADDDQRIWRDEIEGLSLQEQLEIYFGVTGVSDSTILKRLYDEANLKDKHVTQAMLRAFQFADPAICAELIEAEGLGKTARYGFTRNFSDWLDEDGNAFGNALIARLRARLNAQTDWLRTVGDDVKAVYIGKSSGSIGTPSLGTLSGDGWKSQADRGISQQVLDYFQNQPNTQLVLYTNDSVRASVGGVRYEGVLDSTKQTLTLEPVYGGGITLRYENVKLHADGLVLEMEVAERTEARRTIFRRSRRF